ncbi:MAG: VIT domain-containing protein, partial [Planctomycetales bacterium]
MKPPDDGDEELIASMLHSADRNLPLPDPEFLRQLREASTRAFLEAAAQRGGDSQEPQLRPDHTISQEEGDSMISAADTQTGPFTLGRSLGGRGSRRVVSLLVGGVACAVAILVWLLLGPAPQVAHALDLRTALERTAQSQTLHLQIERSGQTEEAWMTQPGWLRVDHSDGTYDITRDNTVWRVDERENRAQSEPTPLGSSGADVHSRVFSQLLDLADGEELTSTQSPSVEVVQRNGRTLQRLQGELAGGDRRLQFDALIDAQTETLQSLRLLTDRDGALQPIVELRVVAANLPLAEEKFTVKPSLTEDGRVGKVTDRQGIVTLRPAAQQRWTPVCEPLLLRTGDWLRTDSRGAHAAAVKLSSQSVLTIGPGTLIEILSPNRVRLHTGELEVQPDSATPLELAGPGDQGVSIAERTFYRLTQEKLTKVTRAPPWLGYFQGTTHQESLGSLIAHPKGTTVETRNIPLTVGYHHVTVDIRDQIARTVIEESFVNRENVELEGVFYFPLPQDASISGFGMWIGNELVEADIVEKQRAREIYEQILREKRDPGLLEWSGGNIFKASVYPIPAHAEKRIKISYTQVLPARGTSYRYSYALQSDLLKLHPLRDLSLDVTVHSALPLRRISSPTHTVRADHTAHAAHVAFAAQDYVPTRDFEVVVETDRQSSDVTLIPHARGDDGYFMLQLAPPAEGTWQRDVVADGEPIELLILADTSLSIGPAARQAQAELVAALCGALAPRDRVNLAVCDVDCRWAFDKPRPAEPQHVAALREHLSRRHSLGWTDLDRAFASAFTQCGPRTQVVYIGDGIVTTGDGSPEEFSRRLKRLKGETPGACHAVAVGNSYETTTLRAIAALGGGTVRQVTGEQGPSFIALELLREISRPGMRDLRVEFHGLRTARVYPERLPNLPGGSQQILVGRYQPAGKDQVGEVVVTGSVEGKPVRLRGSVALRDAEQGNAFIPRLWARQHLDALLQQGSSPAIKDEIIALSEEFQIMTPYTSFLVLETDADRERFKVKRRFRMRDGEEYFQEGRDTASFALVHQAMQRAGSWRVGLQQSVLREFAQLERYRLPQPGRRSNLHNCDSLILLSDGAVSFSMPVSGPVPAGSAGFGGDFTDSAWYFGTSVFDRKESLEFGRWTEESRKLVENETLSAGEVWDALTGEFNSPVSLKKNMLPAEEPDSLAAFDGSPWKREADRLSADFLLGDLSENGLDHNGNGIADSEWGVRGGLPSLGRGVYPAGGGFGGRSNRLFDHYERQQHFFTVDPLFPALAAPSRPSREAPPSWSPPALELSRSLLRTEQLANLAGGLEIDRQTESFDPRWKELTRRARRLDLYSPAAWLTRSESDGDQMLVNWCDAKERGVLGLGFRLGRLRPSAGSDLGPSVLEMLDHSLTPLDQTYRTYQPSLIQEEVGEVFIILTHPEAPHSRFEIRIDANRRVLLSLRHLVDQKPVSTTRFSEFVEVAGRWWPGKIENLDDQERITSVTTQTIVALTPEQLAARTQAELAARSTVQLVSTPWPTVNQAKQAVADPSRTFYTAELALALHFARSQQWTRALEHLDRSEKLAAQQSGVRWIRDSFLQAARRHEPLKQRLLAESRRQDWPAGNNGLFLARHLVGQAAQVLGTSEMLELLEAVKPIYAAQPPHAKGLVRWAEYQVGYIEAAGQIDEALAARRKLAVDDSHDADQQTRFASALFHGGDPEEAYAWLERVLTTDPRWRDDEEQRLRNTVTQFLQQEGRYADLVAYLAQWTGRRPTSSGVYQHYLSALYQNDQVAEADQLIARWLNEGISGDTSEVASARLTASIQLALGQGHSFYIDLIDPQWLAPLARVAEYFAHRDGNFHPADLILGNSRFNASDEGRNLRLKIGKWLVEEFDTLPRLRLQRYVDWALGETGAVTADNWKGLAAKLQARWSDETDPDTRLQWSRTLGQILSQRVGREAYLNFLRLQWREAPALTRATHANELYNALLGEPWGTVLETELLELVPHLSDAEEVDQRLPVQIVALQRLVDWMVGGRNQTGLAKISDLEQLTRQKRAAAQAEQLRLARQETAQRLEEAGQRHEPLLVRWFDIERLTLRAQSDPDETTVVRESWAFLDAVSRSDRPAAEPPAADTGKEPAVSPPMDTTAEALSRRLQERHLSIIAYLALKPGAEKTQVERLLKAIDARIARGTGAEEWKSWKYRLLVALDRPVELQQVLTDWLQGDGANNRWRLSLGYLLAEQGAVPQAIALFEGVEVVDELDPLAYRALAGWYQAANRRESYEQAQRKIYQTLEEWRMGQWLQQQLQPWWRTDKPLPSELDRQVLLMFAALFEKSSAPENYLWQLQQFYQAT